jgi:hypothetical protein
MFSFAYQLTIFISNKVDSLKINNLEIETKKNTQNYLLQC